jgi:hypothetical protein
MNAALKLAPCLLLVLSHDIAAAELDKQTVETAKHFLSDYLKYTNTGNIDLLKLYSDAATIKITVTTQDGATKANELNGQNWKRLLRESWYSGKPAVEPVEFRGVTLKGEGANVEVRVKRYALNRCYWDNNYTLVIAKDSAGQYQVIKEIRYIDHNNQCQPPDKLTINQDIKINQPTAP